MQQQSESLQSDSIHSIRLILHLEKVHIFTCHEKIWSIDILILDIIRRNPTYN